MKKLRRPSVAAWLINRTALSSPAPLEEFAAASRELEKAQSRTFEGDEKAADAWRAAAGRESEAIQAVLAAAEEAAREAGNPPNRQALENVDSTLRAASTDPELRDQVLRGRVERERSAATLGTQLTGTPRPRDGASQKRRERAEVRRELERLESDLADAAAREERLASRVAETEAALRREKAKRAEAKREVAELKRKVRAAKRRAGG